eukprot:scaffold102537_cov54-Phaeocystis_antarctica.AAC.2
MLAPQRVLHGHLSAISPCPHRRDVLEDPNLLLGRHDHTARRRVALALVRKQCIFALAAYQLKPAGGIFLLGAAHFVQNLLCHDVRCLRVGVKQLAARVALWFLLRTVGQRRTVAGTPRRGVCSSFAALGHQTIGGEHECQLERRMGGRRSRKVAFALAREQCEGEAGRPECRLAYLKREVVGKLLRQCVLQFIIAQRLHALGEELGQPLQRTLRVADAINQ